MKMFEVGGCVRDELLGVPSKDIDFAVVLEDTDMQEFMVEDDYDLFVIMREKLKEMGFKIFLETPEFLTVRAQFPQKPWAGDNWRERNESIRKTPYRNLTADFVLARKESDYTDGRRPDVVEPGTLEDDLARRDFTMNAIAKAPDGTLIDPFNGQADITARIIRAVGDPLERLTEDALRAVRAMRFEVTKGFNVDMDLYFAMQDEKVLDLLVNKISDERKKDELNKMFKHDAVASIRAFQKFPLLRDAIFSGRVNLEATMKQKGFK